MTLRGLLWAESRSLKVLRCKNFGDPRVEGMRFQFRLDVRMCGELFEVRALKTWDCLRQACSFMALCRVEILHKPSHALHPNSQSESPKTVNPKP